MITFPNSPAVDQLHTTEGITYKYTANGWRVAPATYALQGEGVPLGGATGTVLTKASAADNDTVWAASSGAGTTVSATAPSTPSNGQGWFDTNTGITYTWVDDGDSSAWVEGGPVAPKPAGRETLTAARTYYVATTGSDSNDGLTVGTPFLTVQKAINTALSLDASIYQVTIQVADGTYTAAATMGSPMVGTLPLLIQGNLATPANVLFSLTGGADVVVAELGAKLDIKGIKLQGATTTFLMRCSTKAHINYQTMNFGACASQQIRVDDLGSVKCLGAYTISGAAAVHWSVVVGSVLRCQNVTITITGTPAFSTAFLSQNLVSSTLVNGCTFSGSATGKRYDIIGNSVCNSGGVTTYLPGDVAGTLATGGQYV